MTAKRQNEKPSPFWVPPAIWMGADAMRLRDLRREKERADADAFCFDEAIKRGHDFYTVERPVAGAGLKVIESIDLDGRVIARAIV